MIHVNRNGISRPDILPLDTDSPARRELEIAKRVFEEHAGQRPEFKVYRDRRVRDALVELFHGKCAYCEAKILYTSPVDIELFRPKGRVVERPDHPGYWWLAPVWENMLISCQVCNRMSGAEGIRIGKANRFPLEDESKRAFHPSEDIEGEQPLLLNPCVDFPENHLVFEENGRVVSDTKRGLTSIAILGLNRSPLVEARRATAHMVLAQIQLVELAATEASDKKEVFNQALERLKQLTDPSEEFAALKRQLLKKALKRLMPSEPIVVDVTTPTVTTERKRRAMKAFSDFAKDQSSYSLADEEGRVKYRGQRRVIERVVMQDIRAIRDLDLDLTAGNGSWLMLLGENATGKSTVLQVTALVLLGAQSFIGLAKTQGLNPGSFVRYERPFGTVKVKLSGFLNPHTLVFHSDRVEFTSPIGMKTSIVFDGPEPSVEGSGWEPQLLLLGYGATRLLPRVRGEVSPPSIGSGYFSRVDNLFNPFVPLLDAETWLLHLDHESFDNTKTVLRDLLDLPSNAELIPEDGHVVVIAYGAHVPLYRLSDGYQSVVAMTIDILQVALHVWSNLQDAEGTVLLDEVGAHLHPTWKMRIVGALRKALPGMQFIATTHDPLCLRGLGKGEVAVLQRGDDSQVVSLSGLPSPAEFRVDQLLASDFFGLNSTIDPHIEAIFDEYYALLALESLTSEQEQRLGYLRQELKDRRHLGTTLRESLMYDAVDRLVAKHRAHPAIPLRQLKQEAVDEVEKIWSEDVP